MTNHQRALKRYEQANLECATIIASAPSLYPEGSLMAMWADVVLTRAVGLPDANAGPLFKAAA